MSIKSVPKWPILPNVVDPSLIRHLSTILSDHATAINQIIDTGFISGGDGTGTVWYYGDSSPDASLGVSGDFYLRTSNGNVYQKNVTWIYRGNIAGTGSGVNTRMLRRLIMSQNNIGYRRYTHHSITTDSTVVVARINIFGNGFQSSAGSNASARVKICLGCNENGFTCEAMLYRTGTTWRVDQQAYLSGGPANTDYYAFSRGSAMPIEGVLSSTGYLFASGATYEADSHTHNMDVPYKINKTTGANAGKNNAEDYGSGWTGLRVDFYSSSGTLFRNAYTSLTSDYIEVRVAGIKQLTDRAVIVGSSFEFSDCNHMIWFYDTEGKGGGGVPGWETMPVVGVTGASDVQGTDLQDLIFRNSYSASPYGSLYTYIWTEKRGYYNYAKDGDLILQTRDRMRVTDGKLELYNSLNGWSSQQFTHLIVGVGTNDSVERVLRRRGVTCRPTVTWDGDYITDLQSIVDLVASTSTSLTLLLFADIKDPQGTIDSGGNWSVYNLSDGSSAGNMTVEDWENAQTEWGEVSDAIFEYAQANGINVIDWYTLSSQFDFSTAHGGLMCVGSHFSVNGWRKIADYADVIRRI